MKVFLNIKWGDEVKTCNFDGMVPFWIDYSVLCLLNLLIWLSYASEQLNVVFHGNGWR